tara:strand:- start:38 stop:337 length:300 start_codon:yes stop_codon:yes gene_type:complete
MPPRRFNPEVMTYTEIYDFIINITIRLKNLDEMRNHAWDQWTLAIRRNEPQHVIDAHQRNHSNVNRIIRRETNKLYKAKDEKIRRLNNEPTIRLNAQNL